VATELEWWRSASYPGQYLPPVVDWEAAPPEDKARIAEQAYDAVHDERGEEVLAADGGVVASKVPAATSAHAVIRYISYVA